MQNTESDDSNYKNYESERRKKRFNVTDTGGMNGSGTHPDTRGLEVRVTPGGYVWGFGGLLN